MTTTPQAHHGHSEDFVGCFPGWLIRPSPGTGRWFAIRQATTPYRRPGSRRILYAPAPTALHHHLAQECAKEQDTAGHPTPLPIRAAQNGAWTDTPLPPRAETMSYFRWLQTATGRQDAAKRERREDDALKIIGLYLAGDADAATDALGSFPTRHNVAAVLWLVAFFCEVLTTHGHTPEEPPESLGTGCPHHTPADATCLPCADRDADFFVAAYQHDTTELTANWWSHTCQHGAANLAVITLAHRTATALRHGLFHQQPRWWTEPAILPNPEEVLGPGWQN